MVSFVKRSLAMLLVVMMVLTTAVTAFAAGSPEEGEVQEDAKLGSVVNTNDSKGTAAIVTYRVVSGKTIKILSYATVRGKKYKVNKIKKNAFVNNPQVTTISLGKNVSEIETSAFNKCTKLKYIHLKKIKNVTFAKNAFKGVPSTTTIKVPKATTAAQLKQLKLALKAAGFKGKVKKASTF